MPPSLLQQLFVSGGLSIETPSRLTAGPAARTVIQPDGDVLSQVTPEFLASEDQQREHRRAVESALAAFATFVRRVVGLRVGAVVSLVATADAGLHRLLGTTRALGSAIGNGGRLAAELVAVVPLGFLLFWCSQHVFRRLLYVAVRAAIRVDTTDRSA